MAAEEGHAEIVSVLIDAGAQLEAKADLDVSAWLVVGTALCIYTETLIWRALVARVSL